MSALVRDVHAGHLREGLGEVEFEHVLITLTGPKTFFFVLLFQNLFFKKREKGERSRRRQGPTLGISDFLLESNTPLTFPRCYQEGSG